MPKNFPNEIRTSETLEESRRWFLIHEIIPELDALIFAIDRGGFVGFGRAEVHWLGAGNQVFPFSVPIAIVSKQLANQFVFAILFLSMAWLIFRVFFPLGGELPVFTGNGLPVGLLLAHALSS